MPCYPIVEVEIAGKKDLIKILSIGKINLRIKILESSVIKEVPKNSIKLIRSATQDERESYLSDDELEEFSDAQRQIKKLIIVPGNATGDLFGITISLRMDPSYAVLILQEVTLASEREAEIDEEALNGKIFRNYPEVIIDPNFNRPKPYVFSGLAPLTQKPIGIDANALAYDVVTWDPKEKCKSAEMEAFIRDSLPSSREYQIFTLPVYETNHWAGKFTRGTREQRIEAMRYALVNARNWNNSLLYAFTQDDKVSDDLVASFVNKVADISEGTKFLGCQPRSDIITASHKAWSLQSCDNDIYFENFLSLFQNPKEIEESSTLDCIPTGLKYPSSAPIKTFIFVLWSRFTGKHGGPHPQHDLGYEALRFLIREVSKYRNIKIVLAGDKHASGAPINKIEPALMNHVWLDLRDFWRTQAWLELLTFLDATEERIFNRRILQIKLFNYLSRRQNARDQRRTGKTPVIHFGMRSGNLESFALIGQKSYYMEEESNREKQRMERWHTSPGQLYTGPCYDRITLSTAPTRTGQYIVHQFSKPIEGVLETRDSHIANWLRMTVPHERIEAKRASLSVEHEDVAFVKGFQQVDKNRLSTLLESFSKDLNPKCDERGVITSWNRDLMPRRK